jgi:hypothetical protein
MENRLALSVTIADGGNVYGDKVIPGAVTLFGLLGSGECKDQVSGKATIALPSYSPSGHLNAGRYRQNIEPEDLTGADAENYSISYTTESENYTVTAKVINLEGTKLFDGNVNFDASCFGKNGIIAGAGSETLKLIGTGTVASPSVENGRQTLNPGDLTLADGENGGLASNYTLIGGSHFGTIIKQDFAG